MATWESAPGMSWAEPNLKISSGNGLVDHVLTWMAGESSTITTIFPAWDERDHGKKKI